VTVRAAATLRVNARRNVIRFVDSYASLLVLLLANFFLLELVDDVRWGALGSTLLSALALLVAISDPDSGHHITRRDWLLVAACVALAPLVLIVDRGSSLVGVAYLLPVALLVTATLPVTIDRVLHHRRVTWETVLGALCAYVLIGLLFAFLYLAVDEFREAPFFAQPGSHDQGEFLYFSFVALTTLGFGDLSPSEGLPQALTVVEALIGSIFLVTLVARLVTLWVRQDEEALR
jgi:ion channel